MVLEFLQSLQEKYTTQKFDKKEELDFVQTKIRETEKFIHLLEKENEQPFSDFSPHTMNSKTQSRLSELNQSLTDLKAQKEQLKNELDELEHLLSKVQSSIGEVKDTTVSSKTMTSTSENSTPPGLSELKKHLNEVNQFLPLDPMRAKLELNKLISKIS